MIFEILLAIVFLFVIAIGACISAVGWMQTSDKLYALQEDVGAFKEENKKLADENRQLKAKISFYENLKESEDGGCDSVTD